MISIIIPAYKSDWCLGDCLNSISKQTLQPHEVLIGIDACVPTLSFVFDAIPPLLSSKVKVFWFPKHSGAYKIRNTLAALSTGSRLSFFDADDIMYPEYLSTLSKYPRDVIPRVAMEEEDHNKIPGWITILVDRNTFISCGGYEGWEVAADSEFFQRISQEGVSVVQEEEVLALRRVHQQSLFHNHLTGEKSKIREEYREIIKDRRKNPVHLSSLSISKCSIVTHDLVAEIVKANPTDKISLIVPQPSPDDFERLAIWKVCRALWEKHCPEFTIVEAPPIQGEHGYWKAKVVNTAVDSTTTPYVWMADADVFPSSFSPVKEAQRQLESAEAEFVSPHDKVLRLDEKTTKKILEIGGVPDDATLSRPQYRSAPSGGMWGMTRNAWIKTGGINEKFSGWGSEDNHFAAVAELRGFPLSVVPGGLYHLHHTRQAGVTDGTAILNKACMVELLKEEEKALPEFGGTDVVIPLGTGSEFDNQELRFALRSMDKFVPWIRRVFVVGEDPGFLGEDVVFIKAKDSYKHCKDANIISKILAACNSKRNLSESFLYCCDDQVVTDNVAPEDVLPQRVFRWSEELSDQFEGTLWKRRVRDTMRLFGDDAFYWEPHIWSPMEKSKFIDMAKVFPWRTSTSCTVQTLYYNFTKEEGVDRHDHKYVKQDCALEGATFVSYGNKAFRQKGFRNSLLKLFPSKSRFEI